MSFFIQTTVSQGTGKINILYPYYVGNGYQGTSVVLQGSVDVASIAPPVPDSSVYNNYRLFLIPLPSSEEPNLFGIVTQLFGRTYWLTPKLTSDYKLQFTELSVIPDPSTPNPYVFIIAPTSNSWRYIKNRALQKYLCADTTDLLFSFVDDATTNCQFWFFPNTSSGPVIPLIAPSYKKYIYYLVTKYNTALSSSTTSPYITQATLCDIPTPAQQFFFKAQGKPTVVAPSAPFTYNMYFDANDDTMLCFEDTTTIGIRTAAGAWEELRLETDPSYFGRFRIVGVSFGARLRAKADGTVVLVSSLTAETDEDYFTFLPRFPGIDDKGEKGPITDEVTNQ